MKILELCLSPGRGGLELYMVKVCRWAKKTQHEVVSITRNGGYLNNWLKEIDVKSIELKVSNRFFPVLAAKKLAKYLDEENIDVIHIHWGKDLVLAVLSKLFSNQSVRLVYTRQMALTRKKSDAYHRYLYKHIDAYVVISRQLYEQAVKYLPISPSHVELLYYGVAGPKTDNKFECDKFLQQFKNMEPKIRVALFGRIEQGKGQHIFLEAVNGLVNDGINICAYLVGHIMDQNYFDSLNEYAPEKNFVYIGFHENPSRFMHCFDVIVLASYCETFGLVLIEAMRAGTAVIGTKCGGVPEIIEDKKTGLLFEPGDSSGLKNALKILIMDENYRKKLAKAGKESADQRFSEEKHFMKLEKILSGRES